MPGAAQAPGPYWEPQSPHTWVPSLTPMSPHVSFTINLFTAMAGAMFSLQPHCIFRGNLALLCLGKGAQMPGSTVQGLGTGASESPTTHHVSPLSSQALPSCYFSSRLWSSLWGWDSSRKTTGEPGVPAPLWRTQAPPNVL